MGTVPAEDGRSTRLTSRRDGPVGTGPVSHAGAPAAMIGPSSSALAGGHAAALTSIEIRARGSSNRNRTASRRRNVQRSAFPFSRVSQAGSDIVAAQLGELRQKLLLGSTAGQVLEYVTDCNPRTSNARLAEPDGRVNRDSIKALH